MRRRGFGLMGLASLFRGFRRRYVPKASKVYGEYNKAREMARNRRAIERGLLAAYRLVEVDGQRELVQVNWTRGQR